MAPVDSRFELRAIGFDGLDGFDRDDALEAWHVLRASLRAIADGTLPLRAARAGGCEWAARARDLLALSSPRTAAAAIDLLRAQFQCFRIDGPAGPGFLTGYYEPIVPGALTRSERFTAPVLARPPGFEHRGPGEAPDVSPSRQAIETAAEAGAYRPILWLRDWVEVFLIQVQGSAKVRLDDGTVMRLIYDGRNGRPYTSIGRVLIENGAVALSDMSLDRLKAWVRDNGQAPGQAGRTLMWRNESYVFFRPVPATDDTGPIGGQGLPLTPLRSIAVDRTIWPYGLPFFITADLPWRRHEPEPFRRLLIAQDTGSAILGPARADLFFGSGDGAGERAGAIRHPAEFTLLFPRGLDPRLVLDHGTAR